MQASGLNINNVQTMQASGLNINNVQTLCRLQA